MADYKRQELIRLLQLITGSEYSSIEFLLGEYSIKFPYKRNFINNLSFVAYSDYISTSFVDKLIVRLKKVHKIKNISYQL